MVDLCKEDILFGIKTARVEYPFFLGGDFCQGFAQGLGGEEVLFVCEKGLDVGKREHHVIRGQYYRLDELVGRCTVVSGLEGLDRLLKVGVSQSLHIGGFGLGGELCADVRERVFVHSTEELSRLGGICGRARVVVIIIVGIVVVCIALYFAGDRTVAAPIVKMGGIPVITGVSVMRGPVSAQTDKNVSAVIVGIHISQHPVRSTFIVHREIIPRPDSSVVYVVVVVPVHMHAVMAVSRYIASFFVFSS